MTFATFASPWPPSARLPGPAWIWAPPRPFPVHLWLAKRAPTTPPAGRDAGATSASTTPPAGKDAGATSNKPARPLVPPASPPARPVGPPPTPLSSQPAQAGFAAQPPGAALAASPPVSPTNPINLAEKLSALLGIPPLPPAHPLVPPASLPARPVSTPPPSPSPEAPAEMAAKATRRQDAGATSKAAEARLDLELRLLFSRGPAPLDEDTLTKLRIEVGQRAWSLTHAIGAPRPADPAWPTVPHPASALEKLRARLVADVDLGLSMVEASEIRYPRPVRNVLLARQAKYIGRRLEEVLAEAEAGTLAQELKHLLAAFERRR